MQEYSGLLKKKQKALGIFEKTKVKLSKVIEEIGEQIQNNRNSIESSEERILQENSAIIERKLANDYLVKEVRSTENTINKIDAILS